MVTSAKNADWNWVFALYAEAEITYCATAKDTYRRKEARYTTEDAQYATVRITVEIALIVEEAGALHMKDKINQYKDEDRQALTDQNLDKRLRHNDKSIHNNAL